MCRLYGFLSNESTKVECSLVHAQNALLCQSRANSRGKAHPDGWGIVCYRDGSAQAERRAKAAHEDLWFSMTAERTYSRAVIAHVRKATVGKVRLENTHPFVHGCWTFAHNGTLAGFDSLRPELEQETDRDLLGHRRGTTDSELVFYWLLARMRRAGLSDDKPCAHSLKLAQVVGQAVVLLDERAECAATNVANKLNLLFTDGHLLLAVRWNHTLFLVERTGVHDCEICGIPHVRHQSATDYRALVVASEPLSHEDWREIPNHTMITANNEGHVQMCHISEHNRTSAGGSCS